MKDTKTIGSSVSSVFVCVLLGSYLISSCGVDSVPCSTLTVAAASSEAGVVVRGTEAGAIDTGVDVWGTGVVQAGLTNPGSVLTTQGHRSGFILDFVHYLTPFLTVCEISP